MKNLTPSQKGAAVEAEVAAAAIRLGLPVLRPLNEGRRYDLVIDLDPRLIRVQCKLARRMGSVLVVGLRTNRCTPGGYVSTTYTTAEVDAIGACSPDTRECFLIPIEEVCGQSAVHLRLDPAENNQSQGIRWARDYLFAEAIQRLVGDDAESR
ncbi:MAG TPA: group I intron-associated PD-(D/E)XK endonuclease [Solirubrobacteraceae bacterium]|nr:group I intron-associated PD-(D/E)XK endonuclease [Solirubrobacteraceae bacterium]